MRQMSCGRLLSLIHIYNAWCCVRPSGTEPKIKFYFGVKGVSLEDSQAKLDALSAEVLGQFE